MHYTALTNYELPDVTFYLENKSETAEVGESSADLSPNRPSRASGRGRYRIFDDVQQAARCRDVIPLHAYILAQELTRLNAFVASSPVPNAPLPENVVWTVYANPYVEPERNGLQLKRDPDAPRYTPWQWSLNSNPAAVAALAEFRQRLLDSSLVKPKGKKAYIPRPELQGVQQLSAAHHVFVARLPENVYDNMSAISRDHDIGFGCFSYALEAAILREQILNPSRVGAARNISNFTNDEWTNLKSISSMLRELLKAHSLP